jgi:uncharacterized protein with HEPN domain
MPRDDNARVLDMVLAARDAREFVRGLTAEQFRVDKRTHSAVCLKLETIGEAARALSREFKDAHADIPWEDIVGLRHRIVHEYFRLDLNILWRIVDTEVSALLKQFEPLVPPPSDPRDAGRRK